MKYCKHIHDFFLNKKLKKLIWAYPGLLNWLTSWYDNWKWEQWVGSVLDQHLCHCSSICPCHSKYEESMCLIREWIMTFYNLVLWWQSCWVILFSRYDWYVSRLKKNRWWYILRGSIFWLKKKKIIPHPKIAFHFFPFFFSVNDVFPFFYS